MASDALQDDLKNLFEAGQDKVHVLADFDGTLTKDFINGKKVPSLISVLRDQPGYLSSQYQEAAQDLYLTYSVFENDRQLSLKERKAKMKEWWEKHDQLLIESGLKRSHLEQVAASGIIEFKEGAKQFLELTHRFNLPVIIFSASGLGEAVPIYCHQQSVDFPNVYFLINRFEWDSDGRAIGYLKPIIHSLNKDETLLSDIPTVYEQIKNRTNVLLLGNSAGDIGMIEGFKPEKLLTIGFIEPEEIAKQAELEKVFRQVICGGYEKINQTIFESVQ